MGLQHLVAQDGPDLRLDVADFPAKPGQRRL